MNIDELFQSATEYHQTGNLLKADQLYREILKVLPDHIPTLDLLGVVLHQRGDHDGAIEYFEKALRLNPHNPGAYLHLGTALNAKGLTYQAMTTYQKAIELNPGFADAYFNLGNVFIAAGRRNEAIQCYQKAVKINPNFYQAYFNLGKAFQDNGNSDKAIRSYKKALEFNQNPAIIFDALGILYQEKGQSDEAISYFQKAVKLEPDFAGAYGNLGKALQERVRFDEALDCYQKALRLNSDNVILSNLYNNIGVIYQAKGYFEQALASYKMALELDPEQAPETNSNISLMLLQEGNFREGWEKYEWRLLKKDAQPSFFSQPQWDGRSLRGKRLLVTAEQGVGDEIMFASCLPEVMDEAALCVVECDKRLVPLFARSFPRAGFIERTKNGSPYYPELPSMDFQIRMGSLPKFLRGDITDFPESRSYLVPDEQRILSWRRRYQELGAGLKIGISWRGGSKPGIKLARSTVLEQWTTLFSVPGIHFISLQYGDCSGEIGEAEKKLGVTVHDWVDADPLKDLDGFAAQIAALDLVISMDNSTVHMAGALGIPVWTLLPFACDWRWMREYEDTPWYKTVRLFRQSSQGDWDKVFVRLTSNLNQYIATGVMPEINPVNSFTSVFKV